MFTDLCHLSKAAFSLIALAAIGAAVTTLYSYPELWRSLITPPLSAALSSPSSEESRRFISFVSFLTETVLYADSIVSRETVKSES